MNLKTKFLLMKIGYNILSYAVIAAILVIAYFYNRIIETSITIVLFFIYRNLFEKQFHAKSLQLCAVISLIVFTIVVFLEVPLTISILYSAVITFILTTISYYVRDYLDNKDIVVSYKKKLAMLDKKCLDNLTKEELLKIMPDISTEIIEIVYGYLHKSKDIKADEYAYRNHISERTLYRYLKLIKERYESLTKC